MEDKNKIIINVGRQIGSGGRFIVRSRKREFTDFISTDTTAVSVERSSYAYPVIEVI